MIRYYFTKNGSFKKEECQNLVPKDDEILLKTLGVGFCTTDLAGIINKDFDIPPEEQGHEGVGEVIALGKDVKSVEIGDHLSTISSGCFSTQYLTREGEYVIVPSEFKHISFPNFILEPVACGINIVQKALLLNPRNVFIMGTGYLALICYRVCKLFDVDVKFIGNYNLDFFDINDRQSHYPTNEYDVVIDLSPGSRAIPEALVVGGTYIMGSIKTISTKLFSWRNITIVNPSPRDIKFFECLNLAKNLIEKDVFFYSSIWNRCFCSYDMDKAVEFWKDREENKINRICVVF